MTYPPPTKAPTVRRPRPGRTVAIVLGSVAAGVVLLICGVLAIGGLAGMATSDDPEPMESIARAAGIPPEPDPQARADYITALNKIDPDIVHGKVDKAVTRGRSQCQSIANAPPGGEAKLIELTNIRFTSPDHPQGFGEAKAARILEAVRTYICP